MTIATASGNVYEDDIDHALDRPMAVAGKDFGPGGSDLDKRPTPQLPIVPSPSIDPLHPGGAWPPLSPGKPGEKLSQAYIPKSSNETIDFTDQFNTPIKPKDQTAWDNFISVNPRLKKDMHDYDVQGWFNSKGGPESLTSDEMNGHLPVTWKIP